MRPTLHVVGTALILLAPLATFAQRNSKPLAACRYPKDGPPTQLTGLQCDSDYSFIYVSDYERPDQNYRRRICNRGKEKVWFDWELTGLKGWAPPEAPIENELPCPWEPAVNEGLLRYDFRGMKTTGYKCKPTKPSGLGALLHSFLSGFLAKDSELVPAKIEVTSSVSEDEYSYEVINDSPVSVELKWIDFVAFWSHREGQYGPQFQKLQREKLLTEGSSWNELILTAHAKIQWTFTEKDRKPQQRVSAIQLFSRGAKPNYDRPDLAGLVSIFLPAE